MSDASRTPLADEAARLRIRGDLGATLVVEAAAGTGKTTELVARLVTLLRTGTARLDCILAVTFTDKAAGELKLRLRGELERAREVSAGAERESLAAALMQLEVASIGTIHSICADLLREFPLEAGIDPQFEVAAGESEQRLLDAAFESFFPRAIAEELPGVRRILRRRKQGFGDAGPREELRRAGRELIQRRDFPAAWKRPPFDRTREIEAALAAVRAAAALFPRAKRADDWIAKSLGELHRFLADLDRREAQGGRDEDGLEAELRELVSPRHGHWRWSGGARWFADGVEKSAAIALRDAAKVALDNFVQASEADLAALLREELRPLVAAYEERKAKAGALDFLDLLLCARDLLRDHEPVRHELQARFTHLLVDEFQDTDPVQAELLFLLAADDPRERDGRRARILPGKLFVVGDPKQSIYRFRRADIALYEEAKAQLLASGATLLHLSVSFRAVPDLQEAINAAFAPRMVPRQDGAQNSQAAYVALDRARDRAPGRPALIALPAPRLYEKGRGPRASKKVIDESYADAVGAFVDWLWRRSGWTIPETIDGVLREAPLEPRHVCLLFKRFASFGRDLTAPYARAFEARAIPHVLVGGRSFHARPEVLALRNALAAIEWPDDELHLFAALRGPLFALTDDQLLSWRGAHQRLSPRALSTLRRCRRCRRRCARWPTRSRSSARCTARATSGRLPRPSRRCSRRCRAGRGAGQRGRAGAANLLRAQDSGKALRSSGGELVPRLRAAARARRRERRDRRGRRLRGGRGGRAPDDGAQGEGARVSRGHPWRSASPRRSRARRGCSQRADSSRRRSPPAARPT